MREEDLIEQMSLEPGRPGVVRLMTLHGAKGLEAKVVFLADPTGDGPSGRGYWIDREAKSPRRALPRRPESGSVGRDRHRAAPRLGNDVRDRRGVRERGEDPPAVRGGDAGGGICCVVSVRRSAAREGGRAMGSSRIRSSPPISPSPLRARRPPPQRPVRLAKLSRRRRPAASPAGTPFGCRPIASCPSRTSCTPQRSRPGSAPAEACPGGACSTPCSRRRCATTRSISRPSPRTSSPRRNAGRDLDEVLRVVEGVRASPLWARARAAKRRLVEVPFALRVDPEEVGLAAAPVRHSSRVRSTSSSKRRTGGSWWTTSRTPSERIATLSSGSTRRRSKSTPVTGKSSPGGPRERGYSS